MIKKIAYILKDKGIAVVRRGKGVRIAAGKLILNPRKIDEIKIKILQKDEKNINEMRLKELDSTLDRVKQGFKCLSGYSKKDIVKKLIKSFTRNISVDFFEEHEEVIDLDVTRKTIQFDISSPANSVLYGIELFGNLCLCNGLDKKETLNKIIAFYEILREKDKISLLEVLSRGEVDPADSFKYFLKESAFKPDNEKERLIAWYRARCRIELPYNNENVRRAILEETDLGSLRQKIYDAIASGYAEEVDTANANRTADWCLQQDKRLVCGRFSRAFYIDAMLLSSAKTLPAKNLERSINKLKKTVVSKRLVKYLGGELQKIINLTAEGKISQAEIEGRLNDFNKALRKFEAETVSEIDGTKNLPLVEIKHKRNKLKKVTENIRNIVFELQSAVKTAPKTEPAFMVFFQRLFPIDAINMGVVNELKDPFFGEDEEVHRLIRQSGHNIYVTPNMRAWLRKCDDWIEALPAYAAYEIIPQEGGGYKISAWVQRSILEDMYRRYAEDWALNIEEVMDLEHVALAREAILGSEIPDIRCEMPDKRKEIAQLAALVGKTYLNLCQEVAACRERQSLSRYDALKAVIHENRTEDNVVSSGGEKIEELVHKYNLEKKTESLLPLVIKKRRKLPCIHVLTTLGPGETEINIENWLEETMVLFNISRARNLGDKVSRKVEGYQKKIIDCGRKVIAELELEGELYRVMEEEGLKPDSAPERDRGILKLIISYPEVSAEVSKSTQIADIRKWLDPVISAFLARREVIAEENLSAELDNPVYRYESSGAYKKYNLLYTPSRVDLGVEEVRSVRDIPKWIGGKDNEAANAGSSLYGLYNIAGPQALNSPRLAEFSKVGENFFSRGGVFYLSLAAGANIDALGIGDFEFFRNQWNMRGDRIVLPTGETYGGFCVPKEFSLLYAIIIAAVNPQTSTELLSGFGVPEKLHRQVVDDMRRILRMKLDTETEFEWELKAQRFLSEKYAEYFNVSGKSCYLPRLSQLADTFSKAGLLAPLDEERLHSKFELANWVNKKVQGLEEINRIGPFRKIDLIRALVKKARRRNPEVVSDDRLIGVMTASYKEGERKHGREIPITDVRFSAGARKLEIYAGTYEHHLLKDIDPEGREIVRKLFADFKSVADIRMVGTCTGSDVLNHVPGAGLEDVKDRVNSKLIEAGLSQTMIDANCKIYGGSLENWAGVKEKPEDERQKLIDEIGHRIHLLVADRRGMYRSYEEAAQGADFIDLGIPDPELLDLVDNLPKLLYLMRRGRPGSALVLADGTSGARRRTFSFRYASGRRKLKELFALDENAVYGALGLGEETVEEWRREMVVERQQAKDLFEALVSDRFADAEETYRKIRERIILKRKDEESADEEIRAKEFGVWSKDYRCISDIFGKVRSGLPLAGLDFGSWVILGGMYILNGKFSAEEITDRRKKYETAIRVYSRRSAGKQKAGYLRESDIDYILESFVKPEYLPPSRQEYSEIKTGIAGSLKAVEEKVARLEKLEERRRLAKRALGLRARRQMFDSLQQEVNTLISQADFQKIYNSAKESLDDGSSITQEKFGRFIAFTRGVFILLAGEINKLTPGKKELYGSVQSAVDNLLNGGEIAPESYQSLAVRTARLSEEVRNDRLMLEKTSMSLEFLDISLIVEKTLEIDDRHELMLAIARFFDMTLNNHIFDYVPYHYHKERGVGFEKYTRQELFELAALRHQWLYSYIHNLMSEKTELKDRTQEYRNAWMGDISRGILPLGINVDAEEEKFWFSYARLRDVAVLRHEGYPLPEIFKDIAPELIKSDVRENVVIVYPHGNTTVPVALEQGAKLAQNGNINLMLTAFPEIVTQNNKKVIRLHDGFMYISKKDYQNIAAHAKNVSPVTSCDEEGVLVMLSFSKPVIAHAVFFHFTHPLRPQIGTIGVPIIQPFIWEAATHLKCRLPDMLKGSGVRTAGQFNWYQAQTQQIKEQEAKEKIKNALVNMAEKYDTLIIKPEKESGGRNAKILPVSKGNRLLEDNILELTNHIYEVSKSDNVVIQQVLKSYVRRLYTPEFLNDMVNRFARIGIPVLLDRDPLTPLFSYFRQIAVLGKDGYEISHHITVVSTQGIANVGQGGFLYEYRDEYINPEYRDALREEISKACYRSIESQKKYIRKYADEILDDYLSVHREYHGKIDIEQERKYCDLPYEMGDYMPVFLSDENKNFISIYDEEEEEILTLFDKKGRRTEVKVYDEKGKPVSPPYPVFSAEGNAALRYDRKGNRLKTLVLFKIEPNPGAGLWRPHNDQLPPERKGEGVYTIFRCLGERAKVYKKQIADIG